MNTLISLPRKSRILYRINQDKLNQYHFQNQSKYNNEHLISNIQEKNLFFPIIQFLSNKIIHQKNISTQTTFHNESINTLSISSKRISELDISNSLSSSLSHTNKTIITNSNSSNIELDLSDKSYTKSNQIGEYKFNDYSSKSQSKHCRIYIQSIVRHMLDDDTFNEN